MQIRWPKLMNPDLETFFFFPQENPDFLKPEHEFYSLNTLTVQYSIVHYSYYTVQLSGTYSSCITDTLYPLNSNSLFPHPPAPGHHHSHPCFYEFDYFIIFI